MTYNNTSDISIEKKYYELAKLDMSSKRSIATTALQLINRGNGGVETSRPVFTELVYKDITLTAAGVIPTGTFVAGGDFVSSTSAAYLIKGDILTYEEVAFKVVEIKNTTTVTLKILSGTDVEIPKDAVLKLHTNATPEGNSGVEDRKMQEHRENYNYTQIVTGHASITGTAAKEKGLAGQNLLEYLQWQCVRDFVKKTQGVIMSNFRVLDETVQPSGKTKVTRYAGGIPFFTRNVFDDKGEVVKKRTDNVIEVNGKLTKDHVNKAFIKCGTRGTLNTIAGTYEQLASLADLETQKVQILNADGSSAKVVGGGIQKFSAPVEMDGNQITHFVLTDELPAGTVLVYNKNAVTAEQLKGRTTVKYVSSEGSTDDNHRLFFRDEFTVLVKEAQESFYYLTGVTA